MQSDRAFRFGPFVFHPGRGQLLEGGTPISLRPKVFDLLTHLVQNPGKIITKGELLDQVWPEAVVSESTLTSTISSLRDALGDDPRQSRYLETVPKRGYRFKAPIEKVPDLQASEQPREAPRALRDGGRISLSRPARMAALLAMGLAAGGWILLPRIISTIGSSSPNQGSSDGSPAYLRRNETGKALLELNHLGVWPAISPDGNWIAFSWEGPQRTSRGIYLLSSQGGDPVQLTDDPNPDWAPVWSPDGQAVAFMRSRIVDNQELGKDIVVIHPFEGRSERLLFSLRLPMKTIRVNMGWGGAGLFFTARRSPDDWGGIYLLDSDSGAIQRYDIPLASPQVIPLMAAPSADGLSLALVGQCPGGGEDVFLLGIDDGSFRRLTFQRSRIGGVSWINGGREIAYANYADSSDDQSRIWAVSPHLGSPRRLPLGIGSFPQPSSDGNLVFERFLIRMEIVELDLDKGRVGEYLSSEWIDYYPQFSPNGREVAFVSSRAGEYKIWLAEHGSRKCRPLIDSSTQPAWSPDGRKIAFTSGEGDIYVSSLDGFSPMPLTLHGECDSYPSWSQDGKWIYFTSRRSGSLEVWKSRLQGGKLFQVTRSRGMRPLAGRSGRFIYYQKPRQDGIWRSTPDGLDETLVVEDYVGSLIGAWAVVGDGIYYALASRTVHEDADIWFWDFKAQRKQHRANVGRNLIDGAPSLSVSPDGRTILLSVEKAGRSEIVLVESPQ